MKLLVLTSEPIGADALRGALPDGVDPADSDQEYRENLDPREIEERFGVAVDTATVSH